MQFIDLKTQYQKIKNNVDDNIMSVLEHGRYIMGPEISELEERLAAYVGTKHCVACSSGTDALLIPLMAWGIGPGDAVLTVPFTFVATAEVINLVGAKPIFVDVKCNTFNMDADALEQAIKDNIDGEHKLKAIIPVDLFGQPAEYEKIEKIAKKYDLLVLEDAAQGFGGRIGDKVAGSFGDCGATSFFPAKPLGGYGDGGAIFTDSDELKELLHSVRVHGMGTDRYENVRIGLNGRLDSIQAAVLLAKLDIFDEELDARQKVANTYNELLKEKFGTPLVLKNYKSAWAQYTLLAKNSDHRERCRAALNEAGIPNAVYYPIPLHMQKAYANAGNKAGDFPISEDLSNRVFSLPFHPYLTQEEITKICTVLNRID